MSQVHKIKPGTMASLMFPGKTHFAIEFDGEKKPDPILTPNQWHDLCDEIVAIVSWAERIEPAERCRFCGCTEFNFVGLRRKSDDQSTRKW